MKIEPKQIKVRDIFSDYADNGDDGVFAYGGKLAIRPPYQREFVYNLQQSQSVIRTILKGFPLNVMYWVNVGNDKYEILDGQQRTLSVMQFLKHQFPIKLHDPITDKDSTYYCDSLPDDKYNAIMNYEFMIYICEGNESEKLDWFRVVNIAGEKLTDQELRNSVYTGTWLSDAKMHFSKRNCAAKRLSEKYINGDPNRQELLEIALKGICEFQSKKELTQYMAEHKSDSDADELWQYFQDVIHWIEKIFQTYHKSMKGVDWCHLYNLYHRNSYNSSVIKESVKKLLEDIDVQKKSGIYEYLLCKDSDPFAGRFLNLRSFTDRDKNAAYARQKGICPICGKAFEISEMEGDHIKPWSKGGETIPENCQMLCKNCNAKKTDKY